MLRQGVVSPETPRGRREREALAEDVRSGGLRGRPLHLRLRNFRQASDGYLTALGGPLPFMVRLREITEMSAEHERRLGEAWRELAASSGGQATFAAAWNDRALPVVVRRGQRVDRPPQPVLPRRVPAADGSQDADVCARRRRGLSPATARHCVGARTVPGRSRGCVSGGHASLRRVGLTSSHDRRRAASSVRPRRRRHTGPGHRLRLRARHLLRGRPWHRLPTRCS